MTLADETPRALPAGAQPGDLFGHPRGLTVLFATEMWERFSYYGMSALTVLYMVKYLFHPGHVEVVLGYAPLKRLLEFFLDPLDPQPLASLIFGAYTGLAYLTPIFGGLLADRVLGQRRTVLVGGALMSLGHFMMASERLLFPALLMLILGVGAFKPNISTQVGGLYAPADARRVRAYSIFYVGINVGAFLAPLVCGTLGEEAGWHYGFAAAGVGMLIGMAIYLSGSGTLPRDDPSARAAADGRPLEAYEKRAVLGLLAVYVPVSLFWAAYDQQGNTLVLFAESFTERSIDVLGRHGVIPTTWFLALNPLMIFTLTPLVLRLWAWQRSRGIEPSTLGKMALGFLGLTLANLVMAVGAWTAGAGGKASAIWLVAYFLIVTLGELHLAPVGLALVSRLAPARRLSMMMGLWFATTFPGDLIGGFVGSFWSAMEKTSFFLLIAAIAAAGGAVIWAIKRPLHSMAGGAFV
jgi:POT family proton-dependent oligopeptide transporter